jgi:hypothetical protein
MLNISYFTTVCLTGSKIGSLVDVQINKTQKAYASSTAWSRFLSSTLLTIILFFYSLPSIVVLGANGIQIIIIYIVEMTMIDTCSFVFLN